MAAGKLGFLTSRYVLGRLMSRKGPAGLGCLSSSNNEKKENVRVDQVNSDGPTNLARLAQSAVPGGYPVWRRPTPFTCNVWD